MSFQNRVNINPPQGWHGDFASANPKITLYGKEGAWKAGINGVQVGSFVWVDETKGTVSNSGEGSPDGFVAREMNGIIPQYLQENSMLIPQGFPVTVYTEAEFLVSLDPAVGSVQRGDKVSVSTKSGIIVAATDPDAVETKFKYATHGKEDDLVTISTWI